VFVEDLNQHVGFGGKDTAPRVLIMFKKEGEKEIALHRKQETQLGG